MASDKSGLLRLNVAQTVLAVLIAGGTVMSVFATYVTVPSEVERVKHAQTNLTHRLNVQDERRFEDHEILVRMEERLRVMQRTQDEMKTDLRAIRR